MTEWMESGVRSRSAVGEITVTDLAVILFKRRFLVLLVLGIALLSGFVWLAMQPDPGYQGTGAIEIVSVPQNMVNEPLDMDVREMRSSIIDALEARYSDDTSIDVVVNVVRSELRIQVKGAEKESVHAALESLVEVGRDTVVSEWLPVARRVVEEWDAYVARLIGLRDQFKIAAENVSSSDDLAQFTAAEMGARERLEAARARAYEARALYDAHAEGRLDKSVLTDQPAVRSLSRSKQYAAGIVVFAVALAFMAAFFAEFVAGVRRRFRSGDGREASERDEAKH